jgi:oligopeptide/dipeptide ABC transporter ATP-binding protein
VTGGAPLLRIEGVRRHFKVRERPWTRPRYVRAVDEVSLELDRGETLALVGESGSGKTTLARLVLRLERPDAGVVQFDGEDVHRLRGRRLRRHYHRVQAVFQNPWSSLDPRMRVGASIAEPLVASGRPRGPEVIEAMTARVGLPPEARLQFPNQFSGGQRQRIAIARALAPDPDLVVLDEPVSALDVSVRAQIMNLLMDVQVERGVAYLMIAHDLSTVRYLANRVAVMYLGRIVEEGPTDRLLTGSRHPYTRALVSAAVTPGDDHGEGIVLQGEIPSPTSPPPGCAFATRCWLYEQLGRPETCTRLAPPLVAVGAGHRAACHFQERVVAEPRGVVAAAGPAAGPPSP